MSDVYTCATFERRRKKIEHFEVNNQNESSTGSIQVEHVTMARRLYDCYRMLRTYIIRRHYIMENKTHSGGRAFNDVIKFHIISNR